MNESFDHIKLVKDSKNAVVRIVIDRPDSLNALNVPFREDFVEALEMIERMAKDDPTSVKVVILEGTGEDAFSAGADIHELKEMTPGIVHPVYDSRRVVNCSVPVIAAIDGYCIGGAICLALACDFRLASKRSLFTLSEVDLGLIPGGGGLPHLTALVGPSRAKELAMTGEQFTAEQAESEGIVDYVYSKDTFSEKVDEFASQIADQAPLPVRAIKDIVNIYQEAGLHDASKYEKRLDHELRMSDDHEEGLESHFQDREPQWQGK